MPSKKQTIKLVGVGEIAAALAIDPRRVQQLAAEGVLPRASRGQYDLKACLDAWAAYKEPTDEQDDSKLDARRKLKADADLAEHKAELARLEVETEQGRLIPADQVADAWGKVLSTCKAQLLAIPSAVAPELQTLATAAEIEAHLRAAVTAALSTLADVGDELVAAVEEAEDAPGAAATNR